MQRPLQLQSIILFFLKTTDRLPSTGNLKPLQPSSRRTKIPVTSVFHQRNGYQLLVHLLLIRWLRPAQPTPKHIWHLTNHHRATIALGGRPHPTYLCLAMLSLTSRLTASLRSHGLSYLKSYFSYQGP